MTIKLFHCITSLDPDGAQQMLLRVIKGLSRDKYKHHVVSLRELQPFADVLRDAGATVTTCNMRAGTPSIAGLMRLKEEIKSFQPTVIQSWLYHANIYAALAHIIFPKNSRCPLLWAIRGSLDSGWERGLATGLVIRASALFSGIPEYVTYNSPESIKQHEKVGYKRDRGIYIPNGFDLQKFVPNTKCRESVRKELGIDDDHILIGLAGRNNQAKDYPGFLRAFAELVSRYDKVTAVIIGRGVDAVDSQLAPLRDDLKINGRVLLLGPSSDLSQFLPGLDIYCSSSVTEGFPNVVAEAMSCEIPCVVTDVGMSSTLVSGLGEVAPPSQPLALSEALFRMCSLSREERIALGKKSRDRIREKYSIDAVIGQFDSLYQRFV